MIGNILIFIGGIVFMIAICVIKDIIDKYFPEGKDE